MFKNVIVKNFRKLEDRYVEFTPGLNIIRGGNEVGKSTLYESILYALFGASALRESVSEVVTDGKPANSMSVELNLELDGVDYNIKRSTSGAEIRWADEVVTGQSATRTFMEDKLGCSMQVAMQLMFAKQKSIQGVISENGAANALVEKLANLGQIESIVDAIQSNLPSGSLTGIDQQIVSIEQNLQEEMIKPSFLEVEALNVEVNKKTIELTKFKDSMLDSETVADAESKIEKAKYAEIMLTRYESEYSKLNKTINTKPIPLSFSKEDLERVRLEAANEALEEVLLRQYNTKFPTTKTRAVWEGDMESLEKEINLKTREYSKINGAIYELKYGTINLRGRLIEDTLCKFCNKDLSEIPAVADTNSKIKSAIEANDDLMKGYSESVKALGIELAVLRDIQHVSELCFSLMKNGLWEYDANVLPPKPRWRGETPKIGEAKLKLPKMERELTEYQQALTLIKQAEKELSALEKPVVPDVSGEEEIIRVYSQQKQEVNSIQSQLEELKGKLASAVGRYEGEMKAYQSFLDSKSKMQKLLEDIKAQRNQMIVHNNLIKKLRVIRPQLAAKMWANVQGAISHYFTTIRGENSVVVRAADGFLVNGKSVKRLSGSTEDILGLAIRMALTKLFIPWVPVLLLDESFSACDEEREMAGVATLAAAGFGQTILVTHSNAPESLTDNLIEL